SLDEIGEVNYEDEARTTKELGPVDFQVVTDDEDPPPDPTTDPTPHPTPDPAPDTTPYPTPDPDEQPEIDLTTNELYPGDTLEVSGTGFTPEGNVGLSWNPTAETTADAEGNISTEMVIPEDTEPGVKELTVTDEASDDHTSAEFPVLDPADQVTEPAMSIDPEEIAVDDVMGDPEEGAGVEHAVQGVAPGSEITYVVTGPAGVNDFESS